MEIVSAAGLSFRYPSVQTQALCDISFSLPAGVFATLCGPSGCGKSTLLRQFKSALAPNGDRRGVALFDGRPLAQVDARTQSEQIGFVGQSPESQIVTDRVWHELAFGLESLGTDPAVIRSRVAETASFFGIQNWFEQDVSALSGGQKQLLNLASVMVMQPRLLLLDEPTAQLDPMAASAFLSVVGRINRELGTTVLIAEHRLEEVLAYSDRLLVMEAGRLVADGTPAQIGKQLQSWNNQMFDALPTPVRIWAAVPDSGAQCPWTPGAGRAWLTQYAEAHALRPVLQDDAPPVDGAPALEIDNVWFRYDRQGPDVLKGASLRVRPGELLAVLGGNGTGKSTMLSMVTGAHRPYRGQIRLCGRPAQQIDNLFDGLLGVLPQNPQTLFTCATVRQELEEMVDGRGLSQQARHDRVQSMLRLCDLQAQAEQHPYDLSGGEQQRAALAKVLLLSPQVLLLDEPTKGMDAAFKRRFAAILQRLLQQHIAIVLVSHDIEFCASYAHRCALFFNGSIVSENPSRAFFSENRFYTTAACRMAKGIIPGAVTAADIITACGGDPPARPGLPLDLPPAPPDRVGAADADTGAPSGSVHSRSKGRRIWRFFAGTAGVLCLVIAALAALGVVRLPVLSSMEIFAPYVLLAAAVLLFAAASAGRRTQRRGVPSLPARRKLPKRTRFAVVILLLAIPVTVTVGLIAFGEQRALAVSLLVLLEAMLPFFLTFEGRRPQARELVVIAVLCALGVAGRGIFYLFPQFKPVAALTVIAGVALGGETGFLVGSMTMLVSNIFFGQGPWTLWQMLSTGLIGFLAGILYSRNVVFRRGGRLSLSVFGFFAVLLLYGGVMDTATAIIARAPLRLPSLLAYWTAGLPMNLVYALATAVFLFLLAEPMVGRLDRVDQKYGLLT